MVFDEALPSRVGVAAAQAGALPPTRRKASVAQAQAQAPARPAGRRLRARASGGPASAGGVVGGGR